jgi:uncharacterized protein (DUF488 family)
MGAPETTLHLIYTVGHSNLELAELAGTLQRFGVEVLADVRSLPRSMRHPQFSRDNLEEGLRDAGLRYVLLGDELGGRPADPKLYSSNGLVDYRARRACHDFQHGIDRVINEARRAPLALLCAEEDPLTCHRFLLITPELTLRGIAPLHIRKGGTLESQAEAEDRLLAAHQMAAFAGASLFPANRSAALEEALLVQAEKCAFRADPQALEYSQY